MRGAGAARAASAVRRVRAISGAAAGALTLLAAPPLPAQESPADTERLADIERPAQVLADAVARACPIDDLTGLDAQAALEESWLLGDDRAPPSGPARRIRVRLALPNGRELEIERRQSGGRLRQFVAALYDVAGDAPRPLMQAFADGDCVIRSGRRIRRDGAVSRLLDQLDGDLSTVRWSETLQAPWPSGDDPGGPRVALVDSGLAYDLPLFSDRLARDASGAPLGYDFWDLDPWPYDGDTARGPFLPIRHGTAVASILAREAPSAALIPYRYPRPDLDRMADLVARAEAAGARIILLPLGSRNRDAWRAFEAAMRGRDLLAIVSAGNDGRDIDQTPVFPAALPLENIITVTSADAFGRLASGSNWGAESVDVMVPGENVPVIDFRGADGAASGSSYAAPRVAALAARILARQPDLDALELKRAILARAAPSPFERGGRIAVGWIPAPESD